MSKKLEAKNALISLLSTPKPAPEAEARPAPVQRTRTAVGGMAQFVTTQSPIHVEAEALREQVKQFEGAKLVRALDPATIVVSDWANRHADNFDLGDFAQLKREIREAGGNVQPIKVRPVVVKPGAPSASSSGAANTPAYEIVYGHRRHRACLELGMPVNALIEPVDDQSLFEQMERENRGRKNLSAWEQGCMYLAALDKGLYPSQRKLSEAIGVDVSLISKSIALARLPLAVVQAFHSPLDIQFRWAQPLGEALAKDPDAVVKTARRLKASAADKPLSAAQIFQQLTRVEQTGGAARTEQPLAVQIGARRVGELQPDAQGGAVLRLAPGTLTPERRAAFLALLQDFFA